MGKPAEVAFLRDGKEHVVKVTTEPLQRALGDPVELKDWGIAVRDITRMMALERHRKSTPACWSIRFAAAAARPPPNCPCSRTTSSSKWQGSRR